MRGKEIGQGHATAFAPKRRGKMGAGSGRIHVTEGEVGGHSHGRATRRRTSWGGGGMAANGVRMGGIHGQPAAAGQCRGAHEPWRGVVHVGCVEGVGGSGKGGSWAGPRATMLIFYLNEFPN
jgi:hypothetical protein